MRFLIENARIGYIGKEIEGVTPYEPGVSISVTATGSLWSDVEETKQYYLFELLQDIAERYSYWKKTTKNKEDYFVYFGYHISSQPMSWDEAQSHNIAKTLGVPHNASIYHRYSDLTGYLWTDVHIKDERGHDVYKEIKHQINELDDEKYICMRFEIILR